MGTIKAKTKEEIIKFRKENSQWGWVTNNRQITPHKRLIVEIYEDGACLAVAKYRENKYFNGEYFLIDHWNYYELIEEPKLPVYRPWTKRPFESMFDANKWEFRYKEDDMVTSIETLGIKLMQINGHHYNLEDIFEIFEMRQENGEWQPCGEVVSE